LLLQNPHAAIQVVENTYCRVIGSVRQSQEKRHIMAFRVVPVNNCNEITSHLLETKYVRLKLKQLRSKMVIHIYLIHLSFCNIFIFFQGQPTTDTSSFYNSSGNNMPGPLAASNNNFGSSTIQGLTPNQNQVYSIIQVSRILGLK
jgi:hypothetical protein